MNLKKLFPNASRDTVALNGEPSSPITEWVAGEEPLVTYEREAENSGRIVLRYTSYRCRLLDEDNWCTKYFTDALRYCGALPDDTPDKVTISVRQEKVAHRSEEKTVIEIEY